MLKHSRQFPNIKKKSRKAQKTTSVYFQDYSIATKLIPKRQGTYKNTTVTPMRTSSIGEAFPVVTRGEGGEMGGGGAARSLVVRTDSSRYCSCSPSGRRRLVLRRLCLQLVLSL